jgi:hypothetical protein
MPVLARVYGIPPKDQRSLMLNEFKALQRDYDDLVTAGGEV